MDGRKTWWINRPDHKDELVDREKRMDLLMNDGHMR